MEKYGSSREALRANSVMTKILGWYTRRMNSKIYLISVLSGPIMNLLSQNENTEMDPVQVI